MIDLHGDDGNGMISDDLDELIMRRRVLLASQTEKLELFAQEALRLRDEARDDPGPCGCECCHGGFCGGCGHAGCGRR